MKTFFLSFFLSFFLVLPIAYAQQGVEDSRIGCTAQSCTAPWLNGSKTITISNFPACNPAVIKFKYRVCPGGKTELLIESFAPVKQNGWNILACYFQFLGAMVDQNGNIDEIALKNFWVDIYRQVTLEMFTSYYNGLPSNLKQYAECDGNNYYQVFEGFYSTCYSICMSYVAADETNGIPEKVTVDYQPCTTSCCIISRKYCWDTATNAPKVLEESNSSNTNEVCGLYMPPTATCPVGVYNYQSQCIKFCGNQ